jgi:hypothetical protein
VRVVVLRMLAKARHSTAHAALVVNAKGSSGSSGGGSGEAQAQAQPPPLTLAVDMGVYTRNRCAP